MDKYGRYIESLPVMPAVAGRIMGIRDDNATISFKDLEELIRVDPALTAKILRVANSALYARQKEVKSLQSAITLLGFKTLKNLVMLVSASSVFKKDAGTDFYQSYWKHSLLTAFAAQGMALRTEHRHLKEEAFLGGLLHDIGKVALFKADSGVYGRIMTEKREKGLAYSSPLEERFFQANHRDVGCAVLRTWSFPSEYVDAALEHGRTNISSPHKTLVMLVSLGDIAAKIMAGDIEFSVAEELAVALARQLQLPSAGSSLREYFDDFETTVKDDPFFREYTALFALDT